MRALVTGASGFVGGAVARALLRRGANVRVLLRAGSVPNLPQPGEVEIVRGDLRDAQAVCAAVSGCEAIFHVGALYSFSAPASEVLAVNVGGTRNVIAAARAQQHAHVRSASQQSARHRSADESTRTGDQRPHRSASASASARHNRRRPASNAAPAWCAFRARWTSSIAARGPDIA